MKNRWISKSTTATRQERRGSMGSMGCDDLSSKDSFCLSPNSRDCVNGIPNWENPMEAAVVSNVETLSPQMWKTKAPADMPRRNSLSNSVVAKHPVSPTKTQNPTNFARMVIECDQKFNSSDGELTFDESLALEDDNFGRIQPNYQIPREILQKEKKEPAFQSPTQVPSRASSIRSSAAQSHPSMSPSSSSIPVSPGMSLEEEEMRQLEIAMERSMQDYNSCASYGNGSLLSDRSYSNTIGSRYASGGRNKTPSVDSGGMSNMTGAGCHLSMVTSSFRSNHTSSTKSSAQTQNHRTDGLHAIVEELEASNRSMSYMNHPPPRQQQQPQPQPPQQPYQDGQFKRTSNGSIDPNLAMARIRELEREKAILEMALHQSTSGVAFDTGNTEIHFQPPPTTSVRPTFSSNRSINSMNTNEIFAMSQPPRQRNPIHRSASVRPNDIPIPSAGCHLQMYAARSQSSRTLNDNSSGTLSLGYGSNNNNSNSNNLFNHNSHSTASTVPSDNTTLGKMIWKRGPNGAWGRFPDDGIDYNHNHSSSCNNSETSPNNNNSNNNNNNNKTNVAVDDDDEDAQIAEALRRSMQHM